MDNHQQQGDAGDPGSGRGTTRMEFYLAGVVLPLPVLTLVGFVIFMTRADWRHDPILFYAWITAMAVGLVSSVRCYGVNSNPSISLFGCIGFFVHLFFTMVLGELII